MCKWPKSFRTARLQEELLATTDKLLVSLMKDYRKPEDLISENGLLKQLTKRLSERAMQPKMTFVPKL
jgi:hypothetical protein